MISQFLAVVCAGLFAGAAVYISIGQHPAAIKLGPAAAIKFFNFMYSRAAPFQASLALIGSLAALWSWWSGAGWLWLLGALFLGFNIPYTLVVIKATNDRLKDPSLDATSKEAPYLLARWSQLHALRSIAGTLAFFIFVLAHI